MIDFNVVEIVPLCAKFGLVLDDTACERLNIYGNMLLEWNEKMNLTAITEPRDVLYKHFFDCLLFFKNVKVEEGASLVDVGTGAGFPGMVLKIARSDINVTLLDGLNKRLVFLNEVISKLSLTSIKTVHIRAEEAARKAEFRERFDVSCARAVANLPVLCEYCIPFVKPGGIFVAMKGDKGDQEAKTAENAYKLLGAQKPNIICETLTGDEKRTFIISKKISQTPPKYPRNSGKISKSAL